MVQFSPRQVALIYKTQVLDTPWNKLCAKSYNLA